MVITDLMRIDGTAVIGDEAGMDLPSGTMELVIHHIAPQERHELLADDFGRDVEILDFLHVYSVFHSKPHLQFFPGLFDV